MSFERRLTYKVYQEDGTFIETLDDVVSDLTIKRQINGGDSEFVFELDRKMDDFDESNSVEFNNRVKVFLKDSFNTAGTKLVASGYIVSYRPFLQGKEEGVEVTCLSAISKLSNDFYRIGTAAVSADLGVERTSESVDQMMSAIITHYRSTEANSMLTAPAGLTTTTDNVGGAFTFTHRFFNMKHLDALREVSKFLPRNKSGGFWFYWRVNTNGDLEVKNVSSTADHTFHISRHIKEISGRKTIEGMVNRVYFWNEKGNVDPDYLKLTSDDTISQTSHDIIAEYITDSKITNSSAAGLLADSKVFDKKDPKVRVEVTLNGEYDLSSINPGETCKILNTKNNPFKVGSDDILVVHSIEYGVDEAKLTLAEASDNFEDIVENERQRLDKEMTWFGFITQALTAAQLGPANRTWSTDISFSATSGGNAYRQVDWTAGTVYVPSGAAGSSVQRVVVAGNTGLLDAATDYFIYLDEETINTSAANSDSGTAGIVRGGDDTLTDSSKAFTTDQYKGYILTIAGQTKIIKSNTATVLTIEDSWTIANQTAAYTIKKMTFETSTSKSAIADITKVIFSNVRANALTTSEAIITTTQGSSSVTNYNLDGATNIAKLSITGNELLDALITDLKLADGAVTAAKTALNAINSSSGDITANHILAGMIQTNAITSVKIFAGAVTAGKINVGQLSAISADMGSISAGTITGALIRTASTNQRIELSSVSTNQLRFFNSDNTEIGQVEVTGNDTDGSFKVISVGGAELELIYATGASSVSNATLGGGGGVLHTTGTATNGVVGMFRTSSASEFFHIARGSSTTKLDTDLKLDAHWLPFGGGTYNLGDSTNTWNNIWSSGAHDYQGIKQPIVYFGFCSSSAVISGDNNAFTAVNTSTGVYTITHSLGHINYAVSVVPFATTVKNITIQSASGTTFVARISNSVTDVLENNGFYFIVTELP
ncbi:MAG: hypothetical protein KJI69_06365 [Patescibacteria group bacterium]|nr:hypothetical protein [Patescibacteria group bacterium]